MPAYLDVIPSFLKPEASGGSVQEDAELQGELKADELQDGLKAAETIQVMTDGRAPLNLCEYAFARFEIVGILKTMEEMKMDLAPEQTKTMRNACVFDADAPENVLELLAFIFC